MKWRIGLFTLICSFCMASEWRFADTHYDASYEEAIYTGEMSCDFVLASQVPVESFYLLPITKREEKIIARIITTMSDNSLYKLLWKKGEMERLGDQIHHVHPLRFLGAIFSKQKLKASMRTVRRSYFKWNGFMNGLNGRMDEEMRNDNIYPHLEGFAEYVNVDVDSVAHYIKRHDWEGLANFLIEH